MKYHLPPPRELTSCDALVARMGETVQARRQAATAILAGKPVPAETVDILTQVLADLMEVGGREAQASLDVAEDQAIALDLTEETRQLENDVVYLEQGREALMKHLGREHHGFRDMVNRGLRLISGQHQQVLLLDADGGLRAPGQRRITAVQPAWNAVSVSRFALARVEHPVLWSAGPLSGDCGLAERLTLPVHVAALAGSLGREHRRTDGDSGQASLSAEKTALLAAINDRLLQLLTDPTWRAFAYVGNGLQLCRSETRAARQDALESVDPDTSLTLLEHVHDIVDAVDPERVHFRVEDNGLDVAIVPTAAGEDDWWEFTPAEGLRAVDAALGLDLGQGSRLVCCGGPSGLALLAALTGPTATIPAAAGAQTRCLFVTDRSELAERAKTVCPATVAVSHPDVLAAILSAAAP